MKQALQVANADFILELESGLDTQIGYSDRGVELTLSQKKRLALARAFI